MNHHKNQKQHRVPRVYLKKFGFEKEGIWYIRLINKISMTKEPLTYEEIPFEEVTIDDFNVTINEFDFPSNDFIEKRHYETTSGLIEGKYSTILNSIKNQNQLTKKHQDILRHFSASLICRAEPHRNFFTTMLTDANVVDKMLEEITMFDKQDKPATIKIAFSLMPKSEWLPLVQGIITNHIVRVLRTFNSLIIQDFNGLGWCTSDNPVCIDHQDNYAWILPAEAEIYLPLSPEYCLFMFNPRSPKNGNTLRSLLLNKINAIDKSSYELITSRLIANTFKALIVPI